MLRASWLCAKAFTSWVVSIPMIYFPIHFEIYQFFSPYSFSKHSPEGDFHSPSKTTSAFKSVFLFNDTLFHRCVTLMTPSALSFMAFWLGIASREWDCCLPRAHTDIHRINSSQTPCPQALQALCLCSPLVVSLKD